jgi:non-heme chloroperoxidase
MNRRNLLAATAGSIASVASAQAPMAQAQVPAPGSARAAPARVVANDGTQLFVRAYGEGPTLFFVGGWCLPSDQWAYQVTPLVARGFRCVTFDRRGHGRSDDPGRGYDYDTLAGDLDSVATALNVTDATLVAYSLGSGEAVRYFSRFGRQRFKRFLLLAPSTPYLAKAADNPNGVDANLFAQGRATIAKDFPRWLDDNEEPFVVPSTSRGMRQWLKAMMLQTSMPALLECNRIMTITDFRPELRALDLPVHIIQGDRDASLPLDITGRPSAQVIRGASLAVYDGAPHGLFVTHAERLNADIELFARGAKM